MEIIEDVGGDVILVWKQEIDDEPRWDMALSGGGSTATGVVRRFREVGVVVRNDEALLEG